MIKFGNRVMGKSTCMVVGLGLGFVVGCGSGKKTPDGIIDSGFETQFSENGLPEGWSIEQQSGKHQLAQAGNNHSGSNSLTIALIDGSLQIHSNPFPVAAGEKIWLEGWFQTADADKNFEINFGAKFENADSGTNENMTLDAFKIDSAAGWQRIETFVESPIGMENPVMMKVVVGCEGSGILRIDDLKTYASSNALTELEITDGNFESAAEPYDESAWFPAADAVEKVIKKTTVRPYAGSKSLSIKGEQGWAMLILVQGIPTDNSVYVEGFARVNEGVGNLKFDYYKEGERVGESYSSDMTNKRWTRVMAVADDEWLPKSDTLRITLVANNPTGKFDISFDEIKVFTRIK